MNDGKSRQVGEITPILKQPKYSKVGRKKFKCDRGFDPNVMAAHNINAYTGSLPSINSVGSLNSEFRNNPAFS